MPEMGEYVVGAYLLLEKGCDGLMYNVRRPEWGNKELDIIAFRTSTMTAYLCEVTTHLDGLVIGNSAKSTFDKIARKHELQKEYATNSLSAFSPVYMFWSPVVYPKVHAMLQELEQLDLVVNEKYSSYVACIRKHAKRTTKNHDNDFMRALQILEHLK